MFTDAAPSQIYPLSLHDALPISTAIGQDRQASASIARQGRGCREGLRRVEELFQREDTERSEEHTSELQSRGHLVCRLLLEKKKRDGGESRPVVGRGALLGQSCC